MGLKMDKAGNDGDTIQHAWSVMPFQQALGISYASLFVKPSQQRALTDCRLLVIAYCVDSKAPEGSEKHMHDRLSHSVSNAMHQVLAPRPDAAKSRTS